MDDETYLIHLSHEAHVALRARCKDMGGLTPSQVIERMLVPRSGRPAGSHGAWDPLMRALRTQVRAADELEVSRATLNRWLSGESDPDERSVERIRRVAKALKVPSPV